MFVIDFEDEFVEIIEVQEYDFFIFIKVRKNIFVCFSFVDSCVIGIGNCFGYGQCQNCYVKLDGFEGKEVCYICYCFSIVSDLGSFMYWVGGVCFKKDVSILFWLFVGFIILLLGILIFSIGMFFSVGEEIFFGVIGVGVLCFLK